MDMDSIQETYRKLYDDHAEGVTEALGWSSYDAQQTRYTIMMQARLAGVRSVLDVGCGYGDALPHLQWARAGIRLDQYLGIDMVPEFVRIARERYPKNRFVEGNFLTEHNQYIRGTYDLVMASGLLGWQTLPDSLNLLQEMWFKTRKVMLFNWSTRTSQIRPDNPFLHELLKQAPGGYLVRNDYLDGTDYTAYMYRTGAHD